MIKHLYTLALLIFYTLTIGMAAYLSGCATGKQNNYSAPVEDLSLKHKKSVEKTQAQLSQKQLNQSGRKAITTRKDIYVVQKGDTLYTIGQQLNLNHRDIAELNKINDGFSIKPGQTLVLPAGKNTTDKNALVKNIDVKLQTKPSPKISDGISFKPAKKSLSPKVTEVKDWIWPTQGEIIATYQKDKNKGINIGGKLDQAILAVAPGKVIYVGSDLLGYGKLIILNHGNQIMSAYANNSKILVREGVSVKKGETIAHMGKTDDGKVQLHFEIRKDGDPVDPLAYLPKKQ